MCKFFLFVDCWVVTPIVLISTYLFGQKIVKIQMENTRDYTPGEIEN
jgi:hypothetical protein